VAGSTSTGRASSKYLSIAIVSIATPRQGAPAAWLASSVHTASVAAAASRSRPREAPRRPPLLTPGGRRGGTPRESGRSSLRLAPLAGRRRAPSICRGRSSQRARSPRTARRRFRS
jgi:hypothetical protein